MSLIELNKSQRGSKLEQKLFSIFTTLIGKHFIVRKNIDRISVEDYGVEIILEDGIVSFKTDEIFITSNNQYMYNNAEMIDFHSELIKHFFVHLLHLLLYKEKLVGTQTGFAEYTEKKIKLSAIS